MAHFSSVTFDLTWLTFILSNSQGRQFTAQAKAKLAGMLVQHYQRITVHQSTTEDVPASAAEAAANEALAQVWQQFDGLGNELYGDRWGEVSRHNVARLTAGATDNPEDLTAMQLQTLITGMEQLKHKRKPARGGKRAAKAGT